MALVHMDFNYVSFFVSLCMAKCKENEKERIIKPSQHNTEIICVFGVQFEQFHLRVSIWKIQQALNILLQFQHHYIIYTL